MLHCEEDESGRERERARERERGRERDTERERKRESRPEGLFSYPRNAVFVIPPRNTFKLLKNEWRGDGLTLKTHTHTHTHTSKVSHTFS